MKITTIAATSMMGAVALIALPAIAHADVSYRFLSPSGNVGCDMEGDPNSTVFAVCKIQDHTWAAAPSEYCQQASVPGATGGPGSDLQLGQGIRPCVGFSMNQFFFSGPYAPSTLGYGQTHTVGAITCDSEQSGVTCTDSSTGHFFRVSNESYQLG
jgi:hypothetical protein